MEKDVQKKVLNKTGLITLVLKQLSSLFTVLLTHDGHDGLKNRFKAIAYFLLPNSIPNLTALSADKKGM